MWTFFQKPNTQSSKWSQFEMASNKSRRAKRLRLWNSELAARVESQLSNASEKQLFRNMLSQNALDEELLKQLLRTWRCNGRGQAFMTYLINAEFLTVCRRCQPDELDRSYHDNNTLVFLRAEAHRLPPIHARGWWTAIVEWMLARSSMLQKLVTHNSECFQPTTGKSEGNAVAFDSVAVNSPSSCHIGDLPENGANLQSPEFDPYATVY